MFFAVVLYLVFGLAAAAIVVGLVIAIVKRARGKRPQEWRDDPSDAEVRMRPGPGWGNGGSWN
jgi:hypothetical protein